MKTTPQKCELCGYQFTSLLPSNLGGQHRAPIGVSTWDGETDSERHERLRRGHERVDAELWAAIESEVNRAFGPTTSEGRGVVSSKEHHLEAVCGVARHVFP